jgi:NAD(P)-dependent dehydrogenase (short-subunit alcohol dehydrogenase family)
MLKMTPKIVLVTGGNGGLGYEAVKALFEAEKSYHIFMGSRSLDKATKAIKEIQNECPKATNKIEPLQVDLTSDESIESAFEKVKSGPGFIDVLVNNAGKEIAKYHDSPAHIIRCNI